ncbi:histidine kinase [Chroococcidiopsis sp. CCALA 051]|uniref:ATP-binding protein n=2 Tax=Bacteria TaxID=2 RepID=UPI000D0D8EA6|nr:ATP-binding protein [Chroococcidiopsis sp. CCALA 051]PSM49417.1 histidine kinase [Chroococcidiopsis sp. CCALA 051]
MKRSQLQRYGISILATAVALLLTQWLWWQLQPTIYPFFLSAVAISSWYGGIGPALVAIALSALASEYFFLPPIYTLGVNWHSVMRIGYFVAVALLIVAFNTLLRSAQRQAQRDRALLQQNQERLYQSEQRYRLMVERVRDYAIFMLDPNGYIINWNVGAERIFGYQEEEIVGKSWKCLFTPEAIERSFPEQELRTAVDKGMSGDDRWYARKDGTLFWANNLITPLRDRNGNLLGFTKIVQDLTDRRLVEEEREQLLLREQAARESAEAANRSKDEFLAIVSHELRTPMTAIVGWGGMLETGKLDRSKTALAVKTIARNANLQMQLIDDLLDISRIVRGNLALNWNTVELASVVTAALEVVRSEADTKGISLNFSRNLSDRLPLLVWGDPNRLQQVMWNLLVNAIKFTPEGGRVEVRLEKVKSQKLNVKNLAQDQLPITNYQLPITNFAQIQVTDTGIGIDRDFLPDVFDRFRQANSASTRAHKGLGLGLAIARHLVELHGGTIEAESLGKGHGATFRVLLPLMNAVPEAEVAIANGGEFTAHALLLDRLRILVVDDELDVQILLRTWLEESGAEVTAVSSVDEAIEVLEYSKPDVLVSDIGMPDKDGYVLIRHVKQIEADTGVKIGVISEAMPKAIALTAYAREEDRTQAMQAGFQLYLTKPVEPNELIAAIASLAQSSERL